MKREITKIVSALLCVATVFSIFSASFSASAVDYSTAYPNTYTNKGNQCEDILGVAYTQIGYTETGSDYTKYNAWMTQATGYNYQGVAWCATFVCWCANQANIPTSIIARNAGCTAMYKSFASSQIHHQSDGYVPRKGDICFLASYNTTDPNALAHVGIVFGTEGSNIKIIEGNCGGKVQMLTRPQYGATYSGQYVVAYATPNYSSSSPVTGISLSATSLSMKVGESAAITASVTPSNAANKTLTFTSSDASVAKVESNGKVTALKPGTAKITVKSSNGITAVCSVTVAEVKKLSSLKIAAAPSKTTYYLWETFSSEGLNVVAQYNDSTTADVTSKCVMSGASTSSVGEKTVTVKYTEDGISKTATFNIVVRRKLKTLTVTSMPQKTDYYVGESLNTTGIQVVAGYSDGSVETVTNACAFSGFSSSSAGTKTVKVSYSEEGLIVSTKFSVRVMTKTVSLKSISVENTPDVTEYFRWETFSSKGIKVAAHYSDSSTKDVTDLCTFIGTGTSNVGTNTVTVRYEENGAIAKATFNILVYGKLKTLSVQTQPSKTEYNIGENFDKSGIKVVAGFSDETTKDVTSLCTFTGFDSSSAGTKTVVVSYTERGIKATAKITVNVLANVVTTQKIGVSIMPKKTQYNVGESFDPTGLKITAYYSDSTKKTITPLCTLSGFDSSKPTSKNVVTATYKEGSKTFTATFSVSIVNAAVQKTPESLTVTHLPEKTEYIAGEQFDRTGLEVVARYSDSSSSVVTTQIKTSGYDCSSPGEKTMTVSYTYLGVTVTDTFKVTIKPKLVSIAITSKPSKLSYYIGESLDLSGMKITATMSDGSTEDFTDKCSVTGFDSSAEGKIVLSVSCKYATVTSTRTFSVIIKEAPVFISGIEIQSYSKYVKRNSDLNDGNLKVIAHYTDATTANVTSSVSISFDSSKIGIKKATVSFTDQTGKTFTDSVYVIVGI